MQTSSKKASCRLPGPQPRIETNARTLPEALLSSTFFCSLFFSTARGRGPHYAWLRNSSNSAYSVSQVYKLLGTGPNAKASDGSAMRTAARVHVASPSSQIAIWPGANVAASVIALLRIAVWALVVTRICGRAAKLTSAEAISNLVTLVLK